jgi:hypothetical protein
MPFPDVSHKIKFFFREAFIIPEIKLGEIELARFVYLLFTLQAGGRGWVTLITGFNLGY